MLSFPSLHSTLKKLVAGIDVLTNPRLAIAGVMSATENRFVVWIGLLCSSFTRINMGTSKRSYLVPLGDTHKKSVMDSNCLAARTGVQQTLEL